MAGGGSLNLELAAAGNTEVVRAKMKIMSRLGIKEQIEDILITLGSQYHLIRPLREKTNLFLYLALNKAQANLAMSRMLLSEIEAKLEV